MSNNLIYRIINNNLYAIYFFNVISNKISIDIYNKLMLIINEKSYYFYTPFASYTPAFCLLSFPNLLAHSNNVFNRVYVVK